MMFKIVAHFSHHTQHICIEVDDVENSLKDLVAKGIRSLDKKPKIGAHGKPVIFLHPKDCGGILLELENK